MADEESPSSFEQLLTTLGVRDQRIIDLLQEVEDLQPPPSTAR